MIRKINSKNVRILSDTVENSAGSPTQSVYLNRITVGSLSYDANRVVVAPDVLTLRAAFTKIGGTTGLTFSLYWNTTVNTSGATQLATFNMAASTTYVQFHRRIYFASSDTGYMLGSTYDSISDVGDYSGLFVFSTITIPNWTTTNGSFFFVCQGVSGNTDSVKNLYLSAEI